MTDYHKKPKIDNMLFLLVEDALDQNGIDYIEEWLSSGPEAKKYYCDFINDYIAMKHQVNSLIEMDEDVFSVSSEFDAELWAALADVEQAAPAVGISKEEPPRELIQQVVYPPRPKREITKFQIFTLIMSAAAVLLLVLLVTTQPDKAQPVASITGDFDAVWDGPAHIDGIRLWNDGTVHCLKQGIAELTFDSGAVVLVESPACFEVLDRNRMHFDEGSLTAKVPPAALNFTVETSDSKVVDLGTEFGLTSSLQKGTEVHVRKGVVEHAAGEIKNSIKFRLSAGQASHIDLKGSFSRVTYKNDQFRWERPNRYETAVIASKPVAYYRFEKASAALGFDEMNKTETPSEPGSINFVDGPDFGDTNKSLHLSGEAGSEVFISDTKVDWTQEPEFTISLWVRPEQTVPAGQNIISQTNADQELSEYFACRIRLNQDNKGCFFIYDKNNGRQIQKRTQDPIPLNQWSHITASYGTENMNIYVNGNLQISYPLPEDCQPRRHKNGFWAIGAETGEMDAPGVRAFSNSLKGAVDEISIYNRQLSDQEVKTLYEAAVKQ